MRKLTVFFSMMLMAGFMALNLTSCDSGGGDEPAPRPTIKLKADVDGYNVLLTVEATDATSLSWNYGDGNISAEAGTHTYIYEASGDYTVTVTAAGEGGTSLPATAQITINPSLAEMIAGVDPAGKSWVLSTTHGPTDGAGPLAESEFNITLPFAMVGNALEFVGVPDEYDNVFTFKPDHSYSIDNVNGQNLCTELFATIAQMQDPSIEWTKGRMGFATIPYEIESSATWAVEEGATISLDVSSEDPAADVPTYTDISATYADVTKLAVTGGYFGILDITNNVIIEDITPEEMKIICIMHTTNPEKPSIFTRVTLVPAE